MTAVYKAGIDLMCRTYIVNRVNAINGGTDLAPYWSGNHPFGIASEYLDTYDRDPWQGYPSVFGGIARDTYITANSLREDIIALALTYNNIVSAFWGGGSGYCVVTDMLPVTNYRPTHNPYLIVGSDGQGHGMSDGGAVDDGLPGTNHVYGAWSGSAWTGDILQAYAITHNSVGGNRWFCFRYNPGGIVGRWCSVYTQDGSLLGEGRIFHRRDRGYAISGLKNGFNAFMGQRIYIYMAQDPPPIRDDNTIMLNHKAAFNTAIRNSVGYVAGPIDRAKLIVLFEQAWNVINAFKDTVNVNLTR